MINADSLDPAALIRKASWSCLLTNTLGCVEGIAPINFLTSGVGKFLVVGEITNESIAFHAPSFVLNCQYHFPCFNCVCGLNMAKGMPCFSIRLEPKSFDVDTRTL